MVDLHRGESDLMQTPTTCAGRLRRPGRVERPPHLAAAAPRLLALAVFILTAAAGCGGRAEPIALTGDGSIYTEAHLVQRVFPEPPGELFGVRGLSIDSTGALYILDSEDFSIHVLENGHPIGSTGTKGDGPGEFPDTPVYMDAADEGVLVTVGGANSRAAFFSNEPAYVRSFSPETLVLQAVLAPGERIAATTIDSPTDPVIFDHDGREIARIELGNDDNTIMDHFIMDAGIAPDGRALLVIGYHFQNRVQVLDLDAGSVISDFSIDGLPPKVDTRPNPSLELFPEGEIPPSIPAELPITTMIQNVFLRGDRIFVHLRDHAEYRGREIHELNPDGSRRRVILLPEPAFAVEIASNGLIYATADTATVVNLYSVD